MVSLLAIYNIVAGIPREAYTPCPTAAVAQPCFTWTQQESGGWKKFKCSQSDALWSPQHWCWNTYKKKFNKATIQVPLCKGLCNQATSDTWAIGVILAQGLQCNLQIDTDYVQWRRYREAWRSKQSAELCLFILWVRELTDSPIVSNKIQNNSPPIV